MAYTGKSIGEQYAAKQQADQVVGRLQAEDRQRGALDDISDRLNGIAERLEGSAGVLARAANRTFGACPELVSDERVGNPVGPDCALSKLALVIARIENIGDDINRTVNRFDGLA